MRQPKRRGDAGVAAVGIPSPPQEEGAQPGSASRPLTGEPQPTTGSWPSDQALDLDDRFRPGGGPQLATASVTRDGRRRGHRTSAFAEQDTSDPSGLDECFATNAIAG